MSARSMERRNRRMLIGLIVCALVILALCIGAGVALSGVLWFQERSENTASTIESLEARLAEAEDRLGSLEQEKAAAQQEAETLREEASRLQQELSQAREQLAGIPSEPTASAVP